MPKREVPETRQRLIMWRAVTTATGIVSAMLAKRAMLAGYHAVRKDSTTPLDPHDERFSWKNAVLWSLAAGVGLGVTRVISTRIAELGWEAATGTLPPTGESMAGAD